MHFDMKNYLKNTHNHTAKHARKEIVRFLMNCVLFVQWQSYVKRVIQ